MKFLGPLFGINILCLLFTQSAQSFTTKILEECLPNKGGELCLEDAVEYGDADDINMLFCMGYVPEINAINGLAAAARMNQGGNLISVREGQIGNYRKHFPLLISKLPAQTFKKFTYRTLSNLFSVLNVSQLQALVERGIDITSLNGFYEGGNERGSVTVAIHSALMYEIYGQGVKGWDTILENARNLFIALFYVYSLETEAQRQISLESLTVLNPRLAELLSTYHQSSSYAIALGVQSSTSSKDAVRLSEFCEQEGFSDLPQTELTKQVIATCNDLILSRTAVYINHFGFPGAVSSINYDEKLLMDTADNLIEN